MVLINVHLKEDKVPAVPTRFVGLAVIYGAFSRFCMCENLFKLIRQTEFFQIILHHQMKRIIFGSVQFMVTDNRQVL